MESFDVLRENESLAGIDRRALFASLSDEVDTVSAAVEAVCCCGLSCLRLFRPPAASFPSRLTGPEPEAVAGANAARVLFCNAFNRLRLSDSSDSVLSDALAASFLKCNVPILAPLYYQ